MYHLMPKDVCQYWSFPVLTPPPFLPTKVHKKFFQFLLRPSLFQLWQPIVHPCLGIFLSQVVFLVEVLIWLETACTFLHLECDL